MLRRQSLTVLPLSRMNASPSVSDSNSNSFPFVVVVREEDGGWHVKMITDDYVISLTEEFSTKHEAITAAAEAFPRLHIDVSSPVSGGRVS